jgi:hypothetical protein
MSGKVTASSESSRVPHPSRALRAKVGIYALFHHRIVSAARQRMTAQQPHQSHQPTAQRSIPLNCLRRIFRAGRNVAARRRNHRRDRPLVASQQPQHNEFGNLAHSRFRAAQRFSAAIKSLYDCKGFSPLGLSRELRSGAPATLPATFCSITTKARLSSFTIAVKSTVSNDFFGLITISTSTTSAFAPAGVSVSRTASRKRRFIRLRCTAPPRARPTVNPIRGPDATGAFAPPPPSGRCQ